MKTESAYLQTSPTAGGVHALQQPSPERILIGTALSHPWHPQTEPSLRQGIDLHAWRALLHDPSSQFRALGRHDVLLSPRYRTLKDILEETPYDIL